MLNNNSDNCCEICYEIHNDNTIKLDCGHNKITSLDNLPPTLTYLNCAFNQIVSLDYFPPTLEKIICRKNKITSLDNFPTTLEELDCYNNPLLYDFEPTLENIRKYNLKN